MVTWHVSNVTNLIISTESVTGANAEVRHAKSGSSLIMDRLGTRTSVVLHKFARVPWLKLRLERHRAGRRVSKAGFSAQPTATEEIDSEEERQTRWKKKETQGWMSWRRSSEHLLRRVLVQGGPPTRFFSKECSPLRAAWRREAVTAALDTRPRGVECRGLPASLLQEESEGQERSPRPESDGEGRTRAHAHEIRHWCTSCVRARAATSQAARQRARLSDNHGRLSVSCRMRRARSCPRSWT